VRPTNLRIPKILFLNPWDRLIGPNRYLADILSQTPELSSMATVVVDHDNEAIAEYRDLGCRVDVWPEVHLIHPRLDVPNVSRNLRDHTLGLAKVVRRVRALAPELVVSNSEILCVGGMAARAARIPHVQVVHSLLFQYRKKAYGSIIGLFMRFLWFWARGFIAVSESVRRMLMTFRIDPRQIAVVPNGFDPSKIKEKSRLPLPAGIGRLLEGRSPVLITVGRIAPMKGQNILIEAVQRLRENYPLLLCLFVGRRGEKGSAEDVDGYCEYLSHQVHRYKLQDCVQFLGEVDYVPELLRCADVYVHPSLTESFSRVVAEALICGKPVVCTTAGALPEVVGEGGAVLVPPCDPEALAAGVGCVLEGKALRQRIISFGQTHVEDHYSIFQTARMFVEAVASAADLRSIKSPRANVC
jgi:glycosyltransferase involved in cell wall biosynthesis